MGRDGLQALTLGALAEKMSMSKSDVFVHFGSRDTLLLAVLRQHQEGLEHDVTRALSPALHGLQRVQAIFECLASGGAGGVGSWLYFLGTAEGDPQSDAVAGELLAMARKQQGVLRACVGKAIASRALQPETAPAQLTVEIHGLITSLAYELRVLQLTDSVDRTHAGFIRLLDDWGTPMQAPRRCAGGDAACAHRVAN